MIVTKEQLEALVNNYKKRGASDAELIGFIDGVEAVMDLIDKIQKESNTEAK